SSNDTTLNLYSFPTRRSSDLFAGVAHLGHQLGGGDQRLGGDAVGQHRRAAEAIAVDHHDVGAELGGDVGGLVAAGSTADDHHLRRGRLGPCLLTHLVPPQRTPCGWPTPGRARGVWCGGARWCLGARWCAGVWRRDARSATPRNCSWQVRGVDSSDVAQKLIMWPVMPCTASLTASDKVGWANTL